MGGSMKVNSNSLLKDDHQKVHNQVKNIGYQGDFNDFENILNNK